MPGTAFEVEHAMSDIVKQRTRRTVDVRRLPAIMAMGSGEQRTAVEAFAAMGVIMRDVSAVNRPRRKGARCHVGDCFDVPRHMRDASTAHPAAREPFGRRRGIC